MMKQHMNLVGPMEKPIGIDKDLFTIFVDGGMNYCDDFQSYMSVGDSDSWDGEHHHQLNKKKERSDLYHALELVPVDIKHIHLYGFSGGRSDHFLMNLGEISHFLSKRDLELSIYQNNLISIKAFGKGKWEFNHKGTFSLFSFHKGCLNLTGECEYTIDSEYTQLIPFSSHGLSNVASGNVCLTNDMAVFVFFNL
jgi:thiamine pyrophosphokinase